MPDPVVYYHNILFLFVIFTLVPLPLALLELRGSSFLDRYKLQPKARVPTASFLRCFVSVIRVFALVVGPLQIQSYPTIKLVGIRMGLPLPSIWEVVIQLIVYFVVEDYGNYRIHRLLHCKWGYEKIHKVLHEFTAPIGFAAPYAHWAEILILGIPSFVGPAIVPGHIITFWLWIALRQIEAIETHCGYDFPFSPTKLIPFYGGPEYHDYHHYVGGQSQSNFASVFTYCDYIYGMDKGYRYQKAQLSKVVEARSDLPLRIIRQQGYFQQFLNAFSIHHDISICLEDKLRELSSRSVLSSDFILLRNHYKQWHLSLIPGQAVALVSIPWLYQ